LGDRKSIQSAKQLGVGWHVGGDDLNGASYVFIIASVVTTTAISIILAPIKS